MKMTLLLSCLAAGLTAFFTLNANAAWRCQASNFYGNGWTATANSRYEASRMAIKTCKWYSRGRSCQLDYCRSISSRYTQGAWQCNVADRRGHVWYGLSSSKQTAATVAYRYCTANSRYSYSCYLMACFRKY